MARKVFYSFHYDADNWRVSKIRNIGAIEENQPASDNDWEAVKKGGDPAIERWIDNQMSGRTCAIVLIGAGTAGRKWINYEIKKAWGDKRGLLGIHIHNIHDRLNQTSSKGANPFANFSVGNQALSSIVPVYDPAGIDSKAVYGNIAANLSAWIDNAIAVRNRY